MAQTLKLLTNDIQQEITDMIDADFDEKKIKFAATGFVSSELFYSVILSVFLFVFLVIESDRVSFLCFFHMV